MKVLTTNTGYLKKLWYKHVSGITCKLNAFSVRLFAADINAGAIQESAGNSDALEINFEMACSSKILYEHHIPTNRTQKALLAFGSAAVALLDPVRHDLVAVLGETTGYSALARLHSLMLQDSEGKEVLHDKPKINSQTVDLESLSLLPIGTLGHSYVQFLETNQVTPDSRLPVQFVDDPDLAYVMQRYREAHDLVHTLLGMPTNMLGEVTVKWVEGIQTRLPMCISGALLGPLRFKQKQREKYIKTYLPWAVQASRSSRLLMNVYFEKRWEQSLKDLRRELCLQSPPA